MSISDFKNHLRQHIGRGAIMECITILKERLLETAGCFDDVYLQESSYTENEKKYHRNVIKEDEYRLFNNKINIALLDIISSLKAEDIRDDFAAMRESLYDLGLPPLSRLALVNCDRTQAFAAFENAYSIQGERPAQFYFFAGCPVQKPNSFSERAIYEVINDVLDNNTKAICCETASEKVIRHKVERVIIRPLPYKKLADANACKTYFQATLEEIFTVYRAQLPAEFAELTAEQLAQIPAGQLPIQFFSLVFQIDLTEIQFSSKLGDYLGWIVETFRQRQHKPPAFQFIFTVLAPGHNHTPHQGLLGLRDWVNTLNENQPNTCAWIEDFEPVTPEDLQNWLRQRFKTNPDESKIKKIVDEYLQHLRQTQRWDGRGGINMADAEDFIKEVYSASQEITAF